jgi:hypothetical protein
VPRKASHFSFTRAQSTASRPRCGFVQLITASVVSTLAHAMRRISFQPFVIKSPAGVDPAEEITLAIQRGIPSRRCSPDMISKRLAPD